MNIVQLDHVAKRYGDNIILQNVNLNIQGGEFVVIMGESGSGKTTILNMIGGLEPASDGDIIIDDQKIKDLTERQRVDFYRHKVGLISQGSYLQPHLTLFENIVLPGIFSRIPKKAREQRARQLAEELSISNVLRSLPSKVSGGQAERTCIARALLLNPKIILADEPTSNLDEGNAMNILNLLNSIRVQYGITIIASSHSQTVAGFATQLVKIEHGSVHDDRTL